MQTYDIYFRGELMPGADSQQARKAVAKMFKLTDESLQRMFSGKRVKIKKAVDERTASRYRKAFREAGALIDIVPHAASPAKTASAPDPETTLTALPPRTGSLEDCAPQVDAAPLPDTAWMSLDAPGTVLDETPAPEASAFDTSAINMAPAGQGSLEDCAAPPDDYPIPDISHLALVEKD